MEITPDGEVLGRWPTPLGYELVAATMTESDGVYILGAAMSETGNAASVLFYLDRSTGTWNPVEYGHLKEDGDPPGVVLLGADGDAVIVDVDQRGTTVARLAPR